MSYISSYFHVVFSTKERRPVITPQLAERLWPYLGGIARENSFSALQVGGVEDHIHVLLSLPATINIAKAVQLIKGGSSKWIHDTFPGHAAFGWQEKYGAFSTSVSDLDMVVHYMKNQAEHHRKLSFKEEFVALLRKHHIEFDERYLWG
jgi:putative transposase